MQPPHFSPFIEAGQLVFLSGQLAFDSTGKITSKDVHGQTTQVLENIEAVLEKLALSRADIVKSTIWLAPGADFVAFNDSYATFFGEHRPARSTVFSALALPSALIEIEVTATRRS